MSKSINGVRSSVFAIVSGFGRHTNTKTVFLPFFGRLGDMIMFLDMLDAYKTLYPREKGYRLILGCRSEAWKIVELAELTQDLEFVELTREKLADYRYLRTKAKEINALQPAVILHVRENATVEDLLVHAVRAKEKVIFRSFERDHGGKRSKYFAEHTYTTDWKPDCDMDQLSCYAEMLRRLGLKNYQSKIALLPKMQTTFAGLPERYVVVCPGASVDNKCWPSSRYAEVVDHIVEKYNKQVVLCGGKNDQKVSAEIVAQVRNSQAVHDITGQTTLEEWIATIQNAEFALTNESGSIHIAASCQVPSVCIGEQKFGDKWLPYRPEYVRPEDRIPVVVRTEKLDCFFCAARNFQRSESCKECYQKNGVIQCVYEVTAQMIMDAVDSMLCGKEQECV